MDTAGASFSQHCLLAFTESPRTGGMPMRWMQISDLHFGYNATTAEKMRENLLEKAKSFGKFDNFM